MFVHEIEKAQHLFDRLGATNAELDLIGLITRDDFEIDWPQQQSGGFDKGPRPF